MGHIGVAVIGAGQAGLSAAHWLGKRGIDHVLFDPSVPGDTWLSRWDSFHLVTPNWTVDLPGFPYTGDDPDGFMHRNEIADHVAAFAEQFRSLIRPARVERLKIGNSWTVDTTDGRWTADAVVVATGSHPVPKRPPVGEEIPSNVFQIHSSRYRSPDELPAGAVLVAGSGQSGAQIVDDLLLGGRRVWFAVGSAAAAPRRYRGRDMAAWFHDLGFMSRPMTPESRRAVSVMVSGRDG
ncbi:MAG: NAD(P)-binding domain-containing protein, partial [Acidimicrobiia bacterium]